MEPDQEPTDTKPERFRPREDDSPLAVALAAMLRNPAIRNFAVQALMWSGLGAALSYGFYRFTVLDKIAAQELKHTGANARTNADLAIERARVDSLYRWRASVDSTRSFTVKDICNRYTKRDQEWFGFACPANIYKGAPR